MSKIIAQTSKDIITITVEVNGKKVWKRYGLFNGKVPKVAKDQLQELVDGIYEQR